MDARHLETRSMTDTFLRSKFMVLCYGVTIIFLYPVFFFPKGALELLINQHHYPAADIFFKYITHLGDGSLLAILLIALLFYSYKATILTAFSIVIQAIIVSIFKRWLYKGLERPLAFFDENIHLNFVDGIDVHSTNTFPSGHTATAFTLFALIFIVLNHRGIIVSTLTFMLAFLVGLSRVYILQHFVIDAYFGAIFGVLSVVLALYLMDILFHQGKLEQLSVTSLKTTFKKKKKN